MSCRSNPEPSGQRTCPRCGIRFKCGAEAGEECRCWCGEFPVVAIDLALPGCLCPACLEERAEGTVSGVRLRDVGPDDLPLIGRWLQANHVRPAWGDPDDNLRLLVEPPAAGHWRAIVEAEGRAVGLVLWQHPTRAELDLAGLADIPASAIDIDLMIGEPDAVGRGIGAATLRRVAAAALTDPAVPLVIGCTGVDNLASQRAFIKAGFCRDRLFDDVPHGPHVLMVRRRMIAA